MFELYNGKMIKQINDCHWILQSAENKFIDYFDYVGIKQKLRIGQILTLINDKYEIRLYEDKLEWNSLGNEQDLTVFEGQWKYLGNSEHTQTSGSSIEGPKDCARFRDGILNFFISFLNSYFDFEFC